MLVSRNRIFRSPSQIHIGITVWNFIFIRFNKDDRIISALHLHKGDHAVILRIINKIITIGSIITSQPDHIKIQCITLQYSAVIALDGHMLYCKSLDIIRTGARKTYGCQ